MKLSSSSTRAQTKPEFPIPEMKSYFAERYPPRSSDAISSTTKDFDLRSRPCPSQKLQERGTCKTFVRYKIKQWNNYRATEEPMNH